MAKKYLLHRALGVAQPCRCPDSRLTLEPWEDTCADARALACGTAAGHHHPGPGPLPPRDIELLAGQLRFCLAPVIPGPSLTLMAALRGAGAMEN